MKFKKLRAKMVEREMTQEKLADVLGISVQTLNSKINGRTQFTLEEVIKMTDILEIQNPTDIFLGKKS